MPSQLNENDGIMADGGVGGGCDFVEMPSAEYHSHQLTPLEIARIRRILSNSSRGLFQEQQQCEPVLETKASVDSEHTEFMDSTHAWCISKETEIETKKPEKRMDRIIGAMIICFQLFTYYLFAKEAIGDYHGGIVQVTTTHDYCLASGFAPQENFVCEAEKTYFDDAFVSFFMLAIFLASDVQQAFRSIQKARSNSCVSLVFALFVAFEVFCAFLAASISISQKLYIGEATDAIEVGVGILFIRELSSRAYEGLRQKKKKVYRSFFFVLLTMIVLGMLVDPLCEALFAP